MQRRQIYFEDGAQDRVAAIDATAGLLAAASDWPEWLAQVRTRTARERLVSLGL